MTLTVEITNCKECQHYLVEAGLNVRLFCCHEKAEGKWTPVPLAVWCETDQEIPSWCPMKNGHPYNTPRYRTIKGDK